MTPQPPLSKPDPSATKKTTHKKLPRLPPTQKIRKRPLLHPPIAAPRTGASTEKVIYVSSSSPFISTVKRVRSYLSHIETRAAGPITLGKHASQQQVRAAIEEGIERARGSGGDVGKGKGRGEEVLLKATGKAIERLLGVALYFQGQEGVKVELRTGSVGAVDDIVERGDGAETGESQVRRASCLEVGVRLV
ncbi:Rpp20 subunit of nuclear RNase MRP and P domain containing protein [Hyaloscypha variabilis]